MIESYAMCVLWFLLQIQNKCTSVICPQNHVVVFKWRNGYAAALITCNQWCHFQCGCGLKGSDRDWFRPSCVCLDQRLLQRAWSISEIRGSAEKPVVLTWLFHFIIAFHSSTSNKVTEINTVMQCNYCFLGIQRFCWQKIIFTLFLNV